MRLKEFANKASLELMPGHKVHNTNERESSLTDSEKSLQGFSLRQNVGMDLG